MATQSWNGIASYSNTKLFLNLTATIDRINATSASVSISGDIYSGTGSGISGDSGGIRLVKFHSNVGTFNVGFYNCLDNYKINYFVFLISRIIHASISVFICLFFYRLWG